MRIGVPKELKVSEYRVELTPDSMRERVAPSHTASVERSAGAAIGLEDSD